MKKKKGVAAPEQVVELPLLKVGGLAHLLHHQVLQHHLALGLLHHALLYGGPRHQAAESYEGCQFLCPCCHKYIPWLAPIVQVLLE